MVSVHWMSGGTIINHDSTSTLKQSVDIFCYPGTTKSILSLWQTVKVSMFMGYLLDIGDK